LSIPDPRFPLPGAGGTVRILGIDPGSQRTGVGIIDVDGAGRATHVFHAPLNLLAADETKEQFPLRLKRLLDALCRGREGSDRGAADRDGRVHA
jgi:crossover junction endodeoxyribonuclease RuvC